MGLYKVMQTLRNKGKIYKPGETIELDDKIAGYIPIIVVPIPESLEPIGDDEELPIEQVEKEKSVQSKKNKGK